MAKPRIYSIPAHQPFVDALAGGIASAAGDDPAALAGYRVLLPTRRSCRSLREAFLRLGGGQPTLLPRMTPIGDVDEDDLLLSVDPALDLTGDGTAHAALSLPPAVSGLRRQLLLMEMIRKRPPHASPDQAALLARELASLIDQVSTERLDFADLEKLDVGEYSQHWNDTLEFLNIVTEHWPAILRDEGALDPADRRNQLLQAQVDAWQRNPPNTPVIAAGSTGSIPATADLLTAVAELPHGAVVLPGLDRDMSDGAWQALGPSHPQYGLKQLLARLGVERMDVADWPNVSADGVETAAQTPISRADLLRLALLPAAVTGEPVATAEIAPDALSGVTRIDCPDPGKEAETIALVMRHTLETPGKTAALITPDRALARRVAAELNRWEIDIDDSAGVPLDQTTPGAFLRLSAAMITSGLAPIETLATLKHPLSAGGESPATFRRKVRALEIAALRGARPASGFGGLLSALGDEPDPELESFIDDLAALAVSFSLALNEGALPLSDILRTHVGFAEALCASDEMDGPSRLWRGEAGEALASFVAELHDALDDSVNINAADYPVLLDTLMSGRVVRARHGKHPRLNIWGPLEARLQHADVLILGGLNEGTWPPEPDASPWMSRPMMSTFGLPLPERRIGLSAHDFAQAFAAPHVMLSRAERDDGTPTVPSRWLRRIENLCSDGPLKDAFSVDRTWLALALALDEPDAPLDTPAPQPRPPVNARPREMSVTRVRTLQRDPYAIYARFILKLKPLDPIDADPGASDRGIVVHDALDAFIKAFPDNLPDDAVRHLLEIGEREFAKHIAWPGVRAFWWPRFVRIAHWFVEDERARRESGEQPRAVESTGSVTFDAPGGAFTLRARADRIDALPGGGLSIIDYKTGEPPTAPQAESGLEPQLPLEAAIVKYGAFSDLERDDVHRLTYIKLSGGRVPGQVKHLKLDVADVAEHAWDGFKRLINEYDHKDKPYLSHLRPMKVGEQGDYDHLARVREWLSAEDDA